MRRPLVIAVGLLALGAGFVLWHVETAPNLAEGLDASTPPRHVALQSQLANAPVLANATAEHDDATPAPAAARAEVASGPTEELRIVEKATGAAIAGVDVRYVDLEAAEVERWFAPETGLGDGARRLAEQGRPFVSDEQGLVHVPNALGQGIVLARSGDLFGLWWFNANDSRPRTLALEPDQDWVVRVRDTAGRPLPSLGLRLRPRRAEGDWGNTIARLETDATGVARLEHARWMLGYQQAEHFAIQPHALLRDAVGVEIDGRLPPLLASELVLPEVGFVEIRLRTPDGSEWREPEPWWGPRVYLGEAADAPNGYFERSTPDLHCSRDAAGRCRVVVQTGLEIRARWEPQALNAYVIRRVMGPRVPLEDISIDLAIGSSHPLLRMRIFDPAGQPLGDSAFDAQLRSMTAIGSGSHGSKDAARTQSDGGLVLAIGNPAAAARTTLVLSLSADPELQAVRVLSTPLQAGWCDLGDVRLARAELLAAGRIIDSTGAPCAEARVAIEAVPVASARASVDALIAAEAAERALPQPRLEQLLESLREHYRQLQETQPFQEGPRWETRSDAQGRFEVRSLEGCERVRVSARLSDGPSSAWLEGPPGKLDYEITLSQGTSVEGRVIVPEYVDVGQLEMKVRRLPSPSEAEMRPADLELPLDATGRWHAENLAAGTWLVEVRDKTAFAWKPLLGLVSVEVVAGLTARAPDLDLHVLRKIEVSVVDEHQQSVPQAYGIYFEPGSTSSEDVSVKNGLARILTKRPVINTWLGFPGRRAVLVEDLRDGATVVLASGYAVRVRLRDLSALPTSPFRLEVEVDRANGNWSYVLAQLMRSAPVYVDASGEALLSAAFAGEHRISIRVRDVDTLGNDGNPRMQELDTTSLPSVVVRDEPGEQVFELELDPAAIAAAVAKLREAR
jgi:hypothetical protein